MSTVPPPPPPPANIPPPPPPGRPPAGPTNELRPSLGKGALLGLLAAAVGGSLWYLVVAGTKRQILYGAIALGLLIGWAVVKGAQRAGAATALIAALIAAVTVIVSYYYIDRYLIIKGVEDLGGSADLSLLPSWTEFTEVLKAGFKEEGSQYLFSIVAVAAAAFLGFTGGAQQQRSAPSAPAPYRPPNGQ